MYTTSAQPIKTYPARGSSSPCNHVVLCIPDPARAPQEMEEVDAQLAAGGGGKGSGGGGGVRRGGEALKGHSVSLHLHLFLLVFQNVAP